MYLIKIVRKMRHSTDGELTRQVFIYPFYGLLYFLCFEKLTTSIIPKYTTVYQYSNLFMQDVSEPKINVFSKIVILFIYCIRIALAE